MPSRKKIQSQSQFSFVSSDFAPEDTSWLRTFSGAARSHAAYWGGSAKYQRQCKTQTAGRQGLTNIRITDKDSSLPNEAFGCFSAAPIERQISVKPHNATDTSLPSYLKPDYMQYLPPLPAEVRALGSAFAPGFSIFEFCGESFVKHFVMLDHEDYSMMFSGYLLLSYAHFMALTGQGTKTKLLKLKSEVIHRISEKLKCLDGLLSPHYLTAILALAAPVACLVSQDLPKGLSIWEYINASKQDSSLCCREYAEVARKALDEQMVHQQAIRELLFKSSAGFQNAQSLPLLQYVSNSIMMY